MDLRPGMHLDLMPLFGARARIIETDGHIVTRFW